MDYQKGQIYTIRSYQTDKYYIGSSCSPLSKRLYEHKISYKNNKTYITCFEILKFDDAYIELLETFPCNSKAELTKREGELIREHKDNIVNKRIEGRTDAEYKKDNKEEIKEKAKKYREINKNKIKQKCEANKEKLNEYYKKYREANREEINTKQRAKRQAKKITV